jgi:hypothetical protein
VLLGSTGFDLVAHTSLSSLVASVLFEAKLLAAVAAAVWAVLFLAPAALLVRLFEWADVLHVFLTAVLKQDEEGEQRPTVSPVGVVVSMPARRMRSRAFRPRSPQWPNACVKSGTHTDDLLASRIPSVKRGSQNAQSL